MGTVLNKAVGAALFGRTRQAVLRMLFCNPGQRFYQRLIIRTAGLGSGTVQRELEELTRAAILTRTVEGHQVYYQANRACPVYEHLRGLIRNTFGVAQVLQSALSSIAKNIRFAFVYGSVADGTEGPESDIDLMILSDRLSLEKVVDALSYAQCELQREVNPSLYGIEEFYRKIAQGHHFVSSILDVPKIFLIGEEIEFKRLAEERLAEGAQAKPERNRRSVRGR